MNRKTPLQYWQSDGIGWPDLQKIALRIFTMSTSSAASERNFSTFGFVHSKLRNCLRPDSVDKLVFIKTNYSALTDTGSGCCAQLYSTDDEETVKSEAPSSDEC
jgi:hypothetical protein